jgi:hypothetical protein
LFFAVTNNFAATNLSVWVYPGSSGRLLSQPDALGNRILDTSAVGYQGGTVPLPASSVVPVKVTISPVAGDGRNHRHLRHRPPRQKIHRQD